MNAHAKVSYKGDKAPAVTFLTEVTKLIKADKYKEAAEAFQRFEKDNPTSDFMIEEAVQFRVQEHIVHKVGKTTPFYKFTLRNPTWSTKITEAFRDPASFDAYAREVEAEVRKLA